MSRAKSEAALADWQHKPGCPQMPERVEVFERKRPDGTVAVIARCCDCAGQSVEDKITMRGGDHARA